MEEVDETGKDNQNLCARERFVGVVVVVVRRRSSSFSQHRHAKAKPDPVDGETRPAAGDAPIKTTTVGEGKVESFMPGG